MTWTSAATSKRKQKRLEACEKVMASGQAVAKDLAVALTARGATRHAQQPFTYGSPPGRDDFYFAGK
jgi:hypothetical protein